MAVSYVWETKRLRSKVFLHFIPPVALAGDFAAYPGRRSIPVVILQHSVDEPDQQNERAGKVCDLHEFLL